MTSPTEIIVPFDKIGYSETFSLALQAGGGLSVKKLGVVKISVTTNGRSKILKLTDIVEGDAVIQKVEKPHSLTKYLSALTSGIRRSTLTLSMHEICFSFIHKKRELATAFFSRVHAAVVETEEELRVKFNIGYLQVDN